jgi:hypothetical protein
MNFKKMERYLRVNLLGPGPSSYKKRIYRAAVSQRLGNTGVGTRPDKGATALLGSMGTRLNTISSCLQSMTARLFRKPHKAHKVRVKTRPLM